MRFPIALVLVACLSACGRCDRGAGEVVAPAVDRSDGEIPELTALKVGAGEIRIDGRIDEAAWQKTGGTGGFVHPRSGRPEPGSPVNGAGWLAWDEDRLYVAVRVADGAPTSPFQPGPGDPHVWERSSGIELMLQPGDPGDNRDYYEVQIDVAGASWTTRFDDYNRPIKRGATSRDTRYGHQEWNPAIEQGIHVDRGQGRYTIEFALPWSDITSSRTAVPPQPGDVWRMNLYSFRDGQRHSLAWSPIIGRGNFHKAARFGRVRFGGSV